MSGPGFMRSFRRDGSVTSRRLSPGTVRRTVRFARPYRRMLAVLFGLIVVDALASAANPLIYRAIIDDGILPKNSTVIV